MAPRVFISAVTREFGTTRQRVANILTRLGYEPVWEDIFGSDAGDLRPLLSAKMDHCAGLIQLVGVAYGAEPPKADPMLGRLSYTQFELHHMRSKSRKTWLIFPGPACTRDHPPAEFELPCPEAPGDSTRFQAERRALQENYRRQLRASEHLYFEPKDDIELELVIERLEPELHRLNRGFRRWQRNVLGLLIGLAVGTIGILIALYWLSATSNRSPAVAEVIASDEAKATITNILDAIESLPSALPHLENELLDDMSKILLRDPYNVRVLLMRAQLHYTDARAAGGKGYRDALSDFARAGESSKQLADPHFGIATVLYQLAVFDLTKRGRFRIHSPGGIRMNKTSRLMEIRYPSWELFVDDRCKLVLKVALDHFEAGRKRKQDFSSMEQGGTFIMFGPQDIEGRIRSIRGLLGYEPPPQPDTALFSVFSTFLSRIDPKSHEAMMRPEVTSHDDASKN